MTGTTPRDAAAGFIAGPPLTCPFGRHYSFATGEYGVQFGYADLTKVMERILGIWDHLEVAGVMDDEAADMFEALLEHIGEVREWTGVPGEFR